MCVIFSNLGSFCESKVFSWQQHRLFADLYGITLANNSVGCNPVSVFESLFGGKRWPFEAISSSLFGDFIAMSFFYFKEVSDA